MYMYIHVCVHVWRVYVCTCTGVYVHVNECVRMYVCIVCWCAYVCVCLCEKEGQRSNCLIHEYY